MRFGWVLRSAAIGFIVLLIVCYLFSFAFSINEREYRMMNKLSGYKDTSFDYLRGSGDVVWLAALGSLVTLFSGGMAAALLSRLDKTFTPGWLIPPVVVAIITILVVDGYLLISWSDSVQKWHKSPVDELGRPFEPIILPALLFLIMVIDGACFLASAAGGLMAPSRSAAGHAPGLGCPRSPG
jgi:hypothetical protein